MAGAQVNYNDPKNYKVCRKKQYEIWMCKPPVGTIVINKLEQSQTVKQLRDKTFFTAAELNNMRAKGNPMFQQLMQLAQAGALYVVKDQEVVLSGTRGELWVTKIGVVQSSYQVMSGGQWGVNWQKATQERGRVVDKEFLLPWIKIRSIADMSGMTMACFVPFGQKGQVQSLYGVLNFNSMGIEHGLGDFIVCGKLPNGQPDMRNRRVVNGAVFADTYNNQGWNNCLKLSGVASVVQEPEPLFPNVSDTAAAFAELVKMFHEEFRAAGTGYKIESKRGVSNDGVDIHYRVHANDNPPIECVIVLRQGDAACKVINMSVTVAGRTLAFNYDVKGSRPMQYVAKQAWGMLHQEFGLKRVIKWELMDVARNLNEAILHDLSGRGMSVVQKGVGRSNNYATIGYLISGHGVTGVELRVRVSLTETNRAVSEYKCKYQTEYHDISRFHINGIQEEAESIVTESLIGAGFPFDM